VVHREVPELGKVHVENVQIMAIYSCRILPVSKYVQHLIDLHPQAVSVSDVINYHVLEIVFSTSTYRIRQKKIHHRQRNTIFCVLISASIQ